MADYCAIANEAAQNLNLKNSEDQESAIKILEKFIAIIDKYKDSKNQFSELYYETYNNIARCWNLR